MSIGQRWPRLLVYVAGPFSPTASQRACKLTEAEAVRDNKQAAINAGLILAALGVMPIVPHTAHGGHPMLETAQPYEHWIEATEELLVRCDLALFLPRWTESNGSKRERDTCAMQGIPYFDSIEALRGVLTSPTAFIDTEKGLPRRLVDRLFARLRDTDRAPAGTAGELPEIPKVPFRPPIA